MKTNLIKISLFSLLVGMMLTLLAPADCHAQNPLPIGAIKLTGLGDFKGHYLTAFYAVGSVNGVAVSAENLRISQVYVKVGNLPIFGDTLLLSGQNIAWQGFAKPNVLLLVVHDQPNFTWANPDTENGQPSYPASISTTDNHSYLAVSTVSVRWINNNVLNGFTNYQFNRQQPLSDPRTTMGRDQLYIRD